MGKTALSIPWCPQLRSGSEADATTLGPGSLLLVSRSSWPRRACHPGGPAPACCSLQRPASPLRSQLRPRPRAWLQLGCLPCLGSAPPRRLLLKGGVPVPLVPDPQRPGRPEWLKNARGRGEARIPSLAARAAAPGAGLGDEGGGGPWARPTPLVLATCQETRRGEGPLRIERGTPSPLPGRAIG